MPININKEYYDKWHNRWSSYSEEVLEVTALIRAIECTNGCIQWAFRDEDEKSLPIERTREAMKLSMGVMKHKVLPYPDGSTLVLPKEVVPIIDETRDIYIRGFKQGDEEAYQEFMALSKSHFVVLGKMRMDTAFEKVKEHFTDIFSEYWIGMGKGYVYALGEFV